MVGGGNGNGDGGNCGGSVVVVVVTADSVMAVAMVAPTVVVAAMAIAVREINKGKFLFAPFAPGAMKDRHRTSATIRQTVKIYLCLLFHPAHEFPPGTSADDKNLIF